MAAASYESNVRIAVSSGLLVALIAFILFFTWLMQRLRPTATALRPMRHPYSLEAGLRQNSETFKPEYIPIVKYSAARQRIEQLRVVEEDHSTSSTSLSRNKDQLQHTYQKAAAVATGEEDEERDTPIKDPGVLNSENKTLPKIQDRDKSILRDEPETCPICTEDFLDGEDVRILPCAHIYHRRCIDSWILDFAGTCPCCRNTLLNVVLTPTSSVEPPQPALLSSRSDHRPPPRAALSN